MRKWPNFSLRAPFLDIRASIFCPNVWKLPEISLRTILLRCTGTYFFIQTFDNSQSLALEHHFEVSKKLIFPSDVWKWSEFSFRENTILRCLKAYIFIRKSESSQFILKEPFEMLKDLFFRPDVSKWPDFSLRTPFWDVRGSNFSSEYLKMAKV